MRDHKKLQPRIRQRPDRNAVCPSNTAGAYYRREKVRPGKWLDLIGKRAADLRVRFIDDTGHFFDAMPYPASAYRDTSPLMSEIRRKGLAL